MPDQASSTPEVDRLVRELAEYWGPAVAEVPDHLFATPALAPAQVRGPLQALRALLSVPAYGALRDTIFDAATGTTAESRRWDVAEKQHCEREAAEARRVQETQDRARVDTLRSAWAARLEADFLAVDPAAVAREGPADDAALFERIRRDFVREWCGARKLPISDEQAGAIAAVHAHTLVRARAGSGKTHAVVARTRFLTEHCGVAPEQILVLAFNTSAVKDVRRKLVESRTAVPHVLTFHALAYQLVRPTETLLLDGGQQRIFRDVALDAFNDPVLGERVRQLMLSHFREDWHTLIGRGLHLSADEGLALHRTMPLLTLCGQRAQSHGEQLVANFLFEHDLPYGYERAHRWGGRTYRPDFTVRLPGRTAIIEYFGLVGDPRYDRQIAEKRAHWAAQPAHTLIELYPSDVARGVGHLAEVLRARFAALGVACEPLPDDVIWERVRDEARSQFADMVRSFMGRCRKLRLTPESLRARLASHSAVGEAERQFHGLAAQFYAEYLDRLRQTRSEDFDGLLERAVAHVSEGGTVFEGTHGRGDVRRLRFVMVDEFQDFSPLYHALLDAVGRQNPNLQLFCVGDDWQAINAFAGATTRFFEQFPTLFNPARVADLTTNRRSSACVVNLGNQLMRGSGNGPPARPLEERPPGRVLVADLDRFVPSDAEQARYGRDQLTPAAQRIVARALRRGGRIALLARTNAAPRGTAAAREERGLVGWAADVRAGLTERERGRVDVRTAHKHKGLEAETVVVLDAVARKYPLVHPDWVFTRALGGTLGQLVEDERRLFYVACSRAKDELVLLTDGPRTPFLDNTHGLTASLDWAEFPPRPDHDTAWVVRVTGRGGRPDDATFAVCEALRAHHFVYRKGRHWARTFARDERRSADDVAAALRCEAWAREGDGLTVEVADGHGVVRRRYAVRGGVWARLTDARAAGVSSADS